MRHRLPVWLPNMLGVGLALVLIGLIDWRVRPLLLEAAEVKLRNEVLDLLYQAVEEVPLSYDTVIRLERDDTGRVTLLQINMSALSAYRSQLTDLLLERIERLRSVRIRVPMGALAGIDLFSGWGLKLPVRVLAVSVVKVDMENYFTSAGINQTRHQILLNIAVESRLLFSAGVERVETGVSLPVAETIIVGAVPEQAIYLPVVEEK